MSLCNCVWYEYFIVRVSFLCVCVCVCVCACVSLCNVDFRLLHPYLVSVSHEREPV